MDHCVYPGCEYYGLIPDNTKYHKCELHKNMCDYLVDGIHMCKLLNYVELCNPRRNKYCQTHNKEYCYWKSYHCDKRCNKLQVQHRLCLNHICIKDECTEEVYEIVPTSSSASDGHCSRYCTKHYNGYVSSLEQMY